MLARQQLFRYHGGERRGVVFRRFVILQSGGSLKADKKPAATTEDELTDPGRLRSALAVLRGQRVVPLQIQAQWLETQMVFEDILKRLNTQVARQFKANKDALKGLLPQEATPVDVGSRKQALRTRLAASRGLMMLRPESSIDIAPPPEENP